jgi:GNAT superfamily N-acetyltransferase
MEIRAATDEDIPWIVNLLKLSLGETLMPKSEEFWRWKHELNPFGPSPVLIAVDNGEIIGVRAFMRWEWTDGDRIYKAVRAVDTATHPLHQGRGIFKKLTLQLADQCREEGVDFIFNTPNNNSMPGYLKMGWISQGRLPVSIKPHLFRKSRISDVSASWSDIQNVENLFIHHGRGLVTHADSRYLFWRYRDNPNVTYEVLAGSDPAPFILVYRLKKAKWITEVRITDFFGSPDHFAGAVRALESVTGGPKIITANEFGVERSRGFFKINAGPQVTTRTLHPGGHEVPGLASWSPSLGDLELF